VLALGVVPHGIARRAELPLGPSVLARPWGVETRVGVKKDGNQTVHKLLAVDVAITQWKLFNAKVWWTCNGSFQKALLLRFCLFFIQTVSNPSNAILGTT
jgi:hypothetical protein